MFILSAQTSIPSQFKFACVDFFFTKFSSFLNNPPSYLALHRPFGIFLRLVPGMQGFKRHGRVCMCSDMFASTSVNLKDKMEDSAKYYGNSHSFHYRLQQGLMTIDIFFMKISFRGDCSFILNILVE